MFKLRDMMVGAATAALTGGLVALWAQPLVPTSWTGNEVLLVQLGGPGGTGSFITLAQMRNATAAVLTATATGAFQATNLMNRIYFTAALTGPVTVNTPTNPYDGEMIELVNGFGTAFTQTITLTASTGQTVNAGAVATLAASASAEWQYVASTTTWYRIR